MDAVCRPPKHGQTGSSKSQKNNPGLRQSQRFASALSLNPLSFTGACCRRCEISIASKKKISNTSGCTWTLTPSMGGGPLTCWSGTARLRNYGEWPFTTRGKAQRCAGFTSTASISTTKWATNCAKKSEVGDGSKTSDNHRAVSWHHLRHEPSSRRQSRYVLPRQDGANRRRCSGRRRVRYLFPRFGPPSG